MSTSKEKHPSWFKMKLERRTMVKQLKPRVAVNVLLACWEFLETGEKPTGLSPIERRKASKRRETIWFRMPPFDTVRYRPKPCGTTWDRRRTRTRSNYSPP